MPKVFISHSSLDRELAEAVVELLRSALALKASEIRCTSVEGHGLAGGADTDESLRAEVIGAEVFVGLMSKVSVDSAYVLFELGARWGTDKELIPLLAPGLDASVLKGPIAGKNALRCDQAAGLHKLVEEVGKALRLEPGAAQPSAYQREVERILALGRAQQDPAAAAAHWLRQLFRSPEEVHVAPSYEHSRGRTNVRDSDARVAWKISSLTPARIAKEGLPFSFTHPAFPLVILGSPRYNSLADALQRAFHLPYQFVDSRHATEPWERRLSVLTECGEEFVSSQDQNFAACDVEYDYAIVLVAYLNSGKKLFWIAGIHSAGTDGAWQFIEENSAETLGWLPARPEELTALLVRVCFRLEGEADQQDAKILCVEPLAPPRRAPLKARSSPPRAVLCDLGDVLMYFDRTRTYRAITHYAPALSWRDVERIIEDGQPRIRDRYETGQVGTEVFCDELYAKLAIDETALPRHLLKEYWSDIFWLNQEMAEALKYLHRQGTHLVLFSNTNPLHFEGIERDYPELLRLFSTRILSYQVGSAKPKGPIFARAIEAVQSELPGCSPAEMLMVDDTAQHVQAARGFGMKALRYQSYPHFVWWARAQGLYIP